MKPVHLPSFLGLVFSILIATAPAQAQLVALSIDVTDNDATRTLNFGVDPNATDGQDTDSPFDEDELPPLSPAFEARFVSTANIGGAGGLPANGTDSDYRNCSPAPGCAGFSDTDLHEIRYQVGDGTGIAVQYNLPASTTIVLRDPAGGAVYTSGSLSGSGSYSVPPAFVSVFSSVVMEVTYSNPLPVELVGFEAVLEGNDALLRWSTASEQNNAGFEVQMENASFQNPKSEILNPQWNPVGWIEGHGTTTELRTYTYRVAGLEPGTHRFRLKQVDFDGAFEYSPEVEVSVEMPGPFVLKPAFPNPFNPQTTVQFGVLDAQPVRIELINVMGQRVRTLYRGTPEAGEMHAVRIEAGDLPSGLYMVRLTGEGFEASQSVMLLK